MTMRDDRRPWKGDGCLVYRRCSTDGQDASLSDQEATVSTERARLGLTNVVAKFEDDGKKGHDETRPGLRAILSYVRTHPNPVRMNADFVPILVYDLARFGRFDDPKKIFAYFVEIEKYGYEFYSVTEKIRSRGNIADFVQAIVKSEQAYDYSVSLSKYGLRTGCSLAQRGFWPGGAAPYAYDRMTYGADGKPKYRFATLSDKTVEKRTPEGNLVEAIPPIEDKGRTRSAYSDKIKTDKVKLVPGNPKQVKVVEFIFKKFAEEGWGIRRIAQALNGRGEDAPRGRFWLHTSVRSVILNPAYKGALVYGRRSDGKHHWLEIEKKDGGFETRIERKDVPGRSFVHRAEENCIVVDDCHEALVTRDLWNKAQERLKCRRHGKIRGLGVRSTFLLSGDGLMSCAHCGYRFQGDTDRRRKTRRYVDGGYHMGGRSVCRCYMVPAAPLEDWIIDEIQARILNGRAKLFANREDLEQAIEDALVAGRETVAADDSEVKALERQLADRKAKVEMLVSSVSAENMKLLDEHLGRLRKEIEAIEGEIRAMRVADRARDIVTRDVKAIAKEAAGYIVNLREVLDTGTPEEKKRFIRDFVGSIVVYGEKREVQVAFFEDGDGNGEAGGLVGLARRAAGEGSPLWSMAPWGHKT
jgi:hypothetical protein